MFNIERKCPVLLTTPSFVRLGKARELTCTANSSKFAQNKLPLSLIIWSKFKSKTRNLHFFRYVDFYLMCDYKNTEFTFFYWKKAAFMSRNRAMQSKAKSMICACQMLEVELLSLRHYPRWRLPWVEQGYSSWLYFLWVEFKF